MLKLFRKRADKPVEPKQPVLVKEMCFGNLLAKHYDDVFPYIEIKSVGGNFSIKANVDSGFGMVFHSVLHWEELEGTSCPANVLTYAGNYATFLYLMGATVLDSVFLNDMLADRWQRNGNKVKKQRSVFDSLIDRQAARMPKLSDEEQKKVLDEEKESHDAMEEIKNAQDNG